MPSTGEIVRRPEAGASAGLRRRKYAQAPPWVLYEISIRTTNDARMVGAAGVSQVQRSYADSDGKGPGGMPYAVESGFVPSLTMLTYRE
jgi:hypothetical protein